MLTHKTTEGKATNQQAAEATRHLNVLAFLHDTKKALHAYHQVVSLDPENAEGWTQLGHLLVRTGQLEQAADAYHKVLARGEGTGNRGPVANAYGTLGLVYQSGDDLNQAEAMYHKVLELDQALECKEGLASDYGNLGLSIRHPGQRILEAE